MARRMATARPMRLAAPVTSATWPCSGDLFGFTNCGMSEVRYGSTIPNGTRRPSRQHARQLGGIQSEINRQRYQHRRSCRRLREDAGFVVAEDFVRPVYSAGSLFRPAFHVTLIVDRAVFTGEMAFAGTLAFGPAELRVLSDLPVGVRAPQIGVPGGKIERRSSVPLLRDSGEQGLHLTQKRLSISLNHARVGRVSVEGCSDIASRVVHQNPGAATLGAADFPGVLIAGIRIRCARAYAPRSSLVPHPATELQMELAVGSIPELMDARDLHLIEASLRVIQGSQNRERNGHDDPIRGDRELRPAGVETEHISSIVIFRDGGQGSVQLNLYSEVSGLQGCRHRFRQTFIPAPQVIPLVGAAKDAEVARYGLVSQQVNEVQRALNGRFRAVFDVVRHVEKLTHGGAMAAGDARLDPVVDAQVIEIITSLIVTVIKRWEAGCGKVLLHCIVDGIKVDVGLGAGVIIPKEKIRFRGLRWLRAKKIVHRNIEALG